MQQLTQDKLPEEVRMLLDNVVDDTAKIAVLLMMEQHLGHVVLLKDFLMYYFEEKGNYGGKPTQLMVLSFVGIRMGPIC